jgi:hypothetical protein
MTILVPSNQAVLQPLIVHFASAASAAGSAIGSALAVNLIERARIFTLQEILDTPNKVEQATLQRAASLSAPEWLR